MRVLLFIAAYGIFVEQNGREPRSVNELASATSSKRSSATLRRAGEDFRSAFPEYAMPTVLWASVREQVAADILDPDLLGLQIGAATL